MKAVTFSLVGLGAALALFGCGGGTIPGSKVPPVSSTAVQVSGATPWGSACGTAVSGAAGEAYTAGSALQPQVAAQPGNPSRLFAIWEQDRWNAFGARGLLVSSSSDGGAHWSSPAVALPFSNCGPSPSPGSLFDRASDPSITAGTVGGQNVLIATGLAFSAANFQAPGGKSAVLVSRSVDGGVTWSAAYPVISDTGTTGAAQFYFNDRDNVAMDPNGPNAYIVWDRLVSVSANAGTPAMMSRSTDGGVSWDAARVIYNPPNSLESFNNQILVLPDHTLIDIFTTLDSFGGESLNVIRSVDSGTTWTAPGSTAAGTVGTIASVIQQVATPNPTGSQPVRDSGGMAQTAVDPVTGAIAVVWQESSFSSGLRNGIAFSISLDKGVTWSAPLEVNGRTDVAAFNPSVHFSGAGQVAVTYYDLRDCNNCTTTLNTGVWLRTSLDSGKTWSADSRVAGPFNLLLAPPTDQTIGTVGNALFLGDQQGLAWNGSAWVSLIAVTGSSTSLIEAVSTP